MKKWNILGKFSSKDLIIKSLLKLRGVEDLEEKAFINPPLVFELIQNQPSEFLTSLNVCKSFIEDSIKNDIPILIYGDYDADGICATSILFDTLNTGLGYEKIEYFIPNRFQHGYGFSMSGINFCLELLNTKYNCDSYLFITVDTGITSCDEVEYLKSLGHKVIITDHHQKPSKVPNPDVLVWNDNMVGATIAWLISYTLNKVKPNFLSYAALATITDVQPVFNFNRAVIKQGLNIMNTDTPIGIKALLQSAGKDGDITVGDLGWIIGPRLNASGRIEDAGIAVKLLLSKTLNEAFEYVKGLERINIERQDLTDQMYTLAESISAENLPKIIISHNENYHEGIIGLVASRISQKYNRPAIILSNLEDKMKASVRSINGINIIDILRKFENLFINVGGHPLAAGFTISKANFEVLKNKLYDFFEENFTEDFFIPCLDIDLEIPLECVDLELLNSLKDLEPFGIGNKEPLFLSKNVGITDTSLVGKEQNHLSLKLYANGSSFKAIWFNAPKEFSLLAFGDKVDIVYTLSENIYNGRKYINILVKDLKKV